MKYEKVNPDLVRKYLEKEGAPTEGSASEVTKRLQEIQEKESEDDLAVCETCNFTSKMEYPECPFCGSSDDEVEPQGEEVKEEKPKGKKAPADDLKRKPKPPKGKAVAKVAPSAVPTEKHLDEEIACIRKAQETGASAMWEIGRHLLRIRKGGLHTLRMADGAPKYKTWGEFCQGELGLTKTYCNRIMNVVERFPEEDVKKIGVNKLGLLAGLKESSETDRLLDAAREGASVSQISEEVKKLQNEKKVERREARADETGSFKGTPGRKPKQSEPAEAPPESETLITHVAERDIVLTLFANGTEDQAVRANKDLPMAHAVEKCPNGITIRYRLVKNDDKTFGLRIERSRD